MKAAIQTIINRINEEAQRDSEARFEELQNNIEETIARENEFVRENLLKRRELVIRHNEQEYVRLLEHLSSRYSRDILAYQHTLVDEIFTLAVEKLIAAPAEELLSLIADSVKTLQGKFTLYLGELSASKVDRSRVAAALGEHPGLEIVIHDEVIWSKSGFLLRNDQVEYNSLFEDLVEDKRNEQSALILKEVFADFIK